MNRIGVAADDRRGSQRLAQHDSIDERNKHQPLAPFGGCLRLSALSAASPSREEDLGNDEPEGRRARELDGGTSGDEGNSVPRRDVYTGLSSFKEEAWLDSVVRPT